VSSINIPKSVKIRKELVNKLLQVNILTGEVDKGKIDFCVKLIKEYNYPSDQIDADVPLKSVLLKKVILIPILVYRDGARKEPVIAMVSSNETSNGSYLNKLFDESGIQFFVLQEDMSVFAVGKYNQPPKKIKDIPYWTTNNPTNKVPKNRVLLPFKDEHELRSVVFKCHTIIYENMGHDPSVSFDELIKLLFLKMYDERANTPYYEFAVYVGESPQKTAPRIRKLFRRTMEDPQCKGIFGSEHNHSSSVGLGLSDFVIFQVLQELQLYSFKATSEILEGYDLKGRVYEQMLGRTFRGGLGQYFTPRTMVKFMIELLDSDIDDKILDPACGTGGFLIMSIFHIRDNLIQKGVSEEEIEKILSDFASKSVYGIDINPRTVRAAKINLIMHGETHKNIINSNGLLADTLLPTRADELRLGTFTKIFSNPPFAGYEKDKKILSKFDLGLNKKGEPKSITKEVLFIEKIVKWLKEGGQAGLVLPLGIFTNPSLRRVREYLYRNTKILAIIGLPDYAFTHTGTSVKGALLFFEKAKKIPGDYPIFMAVAENIGYDSTGREVSYNDLDDIIHAYRERRKQFYLNFSELKDRIDPEYYRPEYNDMIRRIGKLTFDKVPLSSLLSFSYERVNPENFPDKMFKYIETGSVDLEEGKIIEVLEFLGKDAPSRARQIGSVGDFLIPTAKESIVGVAILPEELDGIVVSTRFMVAKPKVDPHFLYYLMRTKEVLSLLRRESTGEIVPGICERSLDNVMVPLPPQEIIEITASFVKRQMCRLEELKNEITELKKSMATLEGVKGAMNKHASVKK